MTELCMTGIHENSPRVANTSSRVLPEEYVEDFDTTLPPATFDVVDMAEATAMVNAYVARRLRGLAEMSANGRMDIMVSGGIDSLHTLAVAAREGFDIHAYTVYWQGHDEAESELQVATELAQALGIPHTPIALEGATLDSLIADVVTRLDTAEPWEIVAGMVLRAVANNAREDSLIVSAAGADALFLGGNAFHPGDSEEGTLNAWGEAIDALVSAKFKRGRFIPDFYLRILGDGGRHTKVWQTGEAVALARRIHPTLVRGENWNKDKLVVRQAAAGLGVPVTNTQRAKSPMQYSSGGIAALVDYARRTLTQEFSGRTYSNPMDEALELVVARLILGREVSKARPGTSETELTPKEAG